MELHEKIDQMTAFPQTPLTTTDFWLAHDLIVLKMMGGFSVIMYGTPFRFHAYAPQYFINILIH